MSKAIVDKERCKACGLCIAYCPKQAIELLHEMNSRGYRFTTVKSENCIGCGICYTVCPDGVFTIKD